MLLSERAVTCDIPGDGRSSYSIYARGSEKMPIPDGPVSLGSVALTKDGSQKRVKDTWELKKMADTNAP